MDLYVSHRRLVSGECHAAQSSIHFFCVRRLLSDDNKKPQCKKVRLSFDGNISHGGEYDGEHAVRRISTHTTKMKWLCDVGGGGIGGSDGVGPKDTSVCRHTAKRGSISGLTYTPLSL